ncbi:MAG: lys1 [Thermoleophilia bacterium]|nr:lys1 [Thermoleophilia bacterium]
MMTPAWLLYGAYGYTGDLVARRAVAAGERPILAGRDAARLEPLARELGLEHRVTGLDDALRLDDVLRDVAAVAHCAGPFSATAAPMVAACLRTGTNYVDISGEIDVFEAIFHRDADARDAGVTLLSGGGFDVVPSDCLAAMVAAMLPDAVRLELAFRSGGGFSRGTGKSAVEALGQMSLARTDGAIGPVPRGRRTRSVDFIGDGRTSRVQAVSWGDVATAYRSTGIAEITVYTQLPRLVSSASGLVDRAARTPMLRGATRRLMTSVVSRLPNPSDEARARSRSVLWARAVAPDGRAAEGRLSTPNSYELTADAVVRIVRELAAGNVDAGALTPSMALGPEFISTLDDVSVTPPALVD